VNVGHWDSRVGVSLSWMVGLVAKDGVSADFEDSIVTRSSSLRSMRDAPGTPGDFDTLPVRTLSGFSRRLVVDGRHVLSRRLHLRRVNNCLPDIFAYQRKLYH
jgi:hypothetical protein